MLNEKFKNFEMASTGCHVQRGSAMFIFQVRISLCAKSIFTMSVFPKAMACRAALTAISHEDLESCSTSLPNAIHRL